MSTKKYFEVISQSWPKGGAARPVRGERGMLFRLVEQMKQAQGITEQLKVENALEWTGRMNNIRACAMKIVNKEIIYA